MLGTLKRPGLVGWDAHNDRDVVCRDHGITVEATQHDPQHPPVGDGADSPAARLTHEETSYAPPPVPPDSIRSGPVRRRVR